MTLELALFNLKRLGDLQTKAEKNLEQYRLEHPEEAKRYDVVSAVLTRTENPGVRQIAREELANSNLYNEAEVPVNETRGNFYKLKSEIKFHLRRNGGSHRS